MPIIDEVYQLCTRARTETCRDGFDEPELKVEEWHNKSNSPNSSKASARQDDIEIALLRLKHLPFED
jgi:hypothetical protein